MATRTAPSSTLAGLVERPRLFALLNRGASLPVTLICASAGSGKTMLLLDGEEAVGRRLAAQPATRAGRRVTAAVAQGSPSSGW